MVIQIVDEIIHYHLKINILILVYISKTLMMYSINYNLLIQDILNWEINTHIHLIHLFHLIHSMYFENIKNYCPILMIFYLDYIQIIHIVLQYELHDLIINILNYMVAMN